jgi:hypothetical protein
VSSARASGPGTGVVAVTEHRQQQDHRHDGEVLEDQEAQAGAAHGGGRRAAVAEQLEHDGGGGQRDEQAGEQRGPQLHPGQHQHPGRDGDGARHLQRAAEQHQPADRQQPADGELDADGEQQQDDADLCCRVDDLALPDDPEGVRPDEDAREQEADDRHDAQPRAGVADDRGGHHEGGDLGEEGRRTGLHREDDRARDGARC